MTRKQKIWMAIGGAVLLVLILVAATRGEKGEAVQVATVGREDIQAKVSANGKIQAVKKVDISANVMGQVTKLAVEEGDRVRAGDFLLEIDPVQSRAQAESMAASLEATVQDMETAKARQIQAQNDFKRGEANFKAGIISQSDFEQLKTALVAAENSARAAQRRVDQAKSGLVGARDALGKSTIKAPMDGVVTARRIEQGETAVPGLQNQPGTVLLTISDMSKVEAEMEVDEASIPNVKLGQDAQVRIDAYPNQAFDAVVTEVGGSPITKLSLNEATKFKVKVQIQNPPATIKPGLSAQADIFTGRQAQALAIPIQALVMKDLKPKPGAEGEKAVGQGKAAPPKEEEGVYLMENGKARFVALKTGLMGELNVEVTEGLKGGETLITGPFKVLRNLKEGDLVRVDKGKKKDPKAEDKK